MGKPVVTADDLAFATEILDAVKTGDQRGLAKVLARVHDRAVVCASIRLEREYGLVQRALVASPPSSEGEKT